MQNLNHFHTDGRSGQPARWSRRLTAGATAVLLGASGLGFTAAAHAAPSDAGTRDTQTPTYVPAASILPTTVETEAEHYNAWHYGPGDGYAQQAQQQRNGLLLDAGVPTQVIRGNGNDVDQAADPTPLGDILNGLELVASDTAELSYQVGVRVDVNASGTWDEGDLWTTLRAPAGDPSVWTTSQAVGGMAAGATAPAGEMLAALGDRAYAISTGFLAWKPAEPVLVSSFTDVSGVTKFRPAPVTTPAGKEDWEVAPKIRPSADIFPGWHSVAEAGGEVYYQDMTGQWVPGGLHMIGKVQLINGFAVEGYLANGIDRAQSMQVKASPKSPWDRSPDEGLSAPLWAQVLVRAYPEGTRDAPVEVTVRAAVPKNGDLSQATEWLLSAPVGGIPADTPVPFDDIRAALGEHDVTGYGVFLDSGDYAYLGRIVFNGTTTGFVKPPPVWIPDPFFEVTPQYARPGQEVVIRSWPYTVDTSVQLSGLCPQTALVDPKQTVTITCTVPAGQESGELKLTAKGKQTGTWGGAVLTVLPAADPELTTPVDPTAPGESFTFTGVGFAPGEAVTVTGVCAQEVVADAQGAITVECTVPDTHLPGVVTVQATGQKSGIVVSADATIGVASVDPVWSRLGGADRFETAVKVSREHFPNGAKAVVLSRYDVPADALTAAPFAVKQNAPMLLTQTGTLTAATKTELQRLKPDTVYIAGGTGAVSGTVEQQVRALGVKTVRMGGSDRYATANQIAKTGWGKTGADAVFVATGRDFPDALSAGAAAGSVDAPVLLVDGKAGSVRQDVQAQLGALKPDAVHIAGGTGVVSKGIEAGLGKTAKTARHSGADRYATSAAIGKVWHTKSGAVYLATGAGFADALTGAAVAGGKPGPVLLVRQGCVPASVAGVLGEIAPRTGYVLGGSGVVSERVLTNRNTCA